MDRKKTDLPAYKLASETNLVRRGVRGVVHTAYAIRSPLGSEERGVGCPRVVVGAAAHMASGLCQLASIAPSEAWWGALGDSAVPETSDIGGCEQRCGRAGCSVWYASYMYGRVQMTTKLAELLFQHAMRPSFGGDGPCSSLSCPSSTYLPCCLH